jgi:hypothetical protein
MMTSSSSKSGSRKGRVEAYERMRANEERISALRGQTVLMKQSLKSAKKPGTSTIAGMESPSKGKNGSTPVNDTNLFAVTTDGYPMPDTTQYSQLDAKQYT